jgi:hypothetical protein
VPDSLADGTSVTGPVGDGGGDDVRLGNDGVEGGTGDGATLRHPATTTDTPATTKPARTAVSTFAQTQRARRS